MHDISQLSTRTKKLPPLRVGIGGPGITKSDLLIINKTDLAPYVEVSLDVMASDTTHMCRGKPFIMTDLKHGNGVDEVIDFLKKEGLFAAPV